jgi:hypothetical protein
MYGYYTEREVVDGETYWNLYVSDDEGCTWEYYNWYNDREVADSTGLDWCDSEGRL